MTSPEGLPLHTLSRRVPSDVDFPSRSGEVELCAHDPLTGKDHRRTTVIAPAGAVLIVDSVFAFRPEYTGWTSTQISRCAGASRETLGWRASGKPSACIATGITSQR